MIEMLLVGVIVLVATLYAAWALLPAAGRQRVLRHLARLSATGGVPASLQRGVQSLERRARSAADHCADCSSQPPDDEAPR
jgi:hypothetical protein